VLGAIIEHTGEPELWRRYLALLSTECMPARMPYCQKGAAGQRIRAGAVDRILRHGDDCR
jgi:hypothetical protein